MSILVDRSNKVIVQGFTGRIGSFHAQEMMEAGTNVVGGVTPGRGGGEHLGLPVFDTVSQAVRETGADTSIIFVPPPYAADAAMEAAEAGIELAVLITDGIPGQDMMQVKRYIRRHDPANRITIVGPNCSGVISPEKALVGIMPTNIFLPGRVGIVSRSGTLGYEAADQMKAHGIGVSTSVGIGGDPINGSSFKDVLARFEADPETDAMVMIGEIGGPQEAAAADHIRTHVSKPVIAYIAGLSAPPGRRMGHAGAIIQAAGEAASEKVALLQDAGVAIAPTPSEIGDTVADTLKVAA